MVPAKQQGKTDEYFLSFEERENAKKKKTEYLLLQAELEHSLVSSLRVAKPDLSLDEQTWAGVGPALRAALETVLWRRGEAFANATKTGDIQVIDGAEILSLLAASDVAGAVAGHMSPEDIAATVIEVLERPSSQVRLYLHRLRPPEVGERRLFNLIMV